ncbi:hypothetical protein COU74_04815 [Candidatus Peregrinibacteria bacterium CG10_big_fil_rev_8_21_14_0_10_36_19]|nr:MAG: hypothetical protein COU74_04815 [Candidatus Peregrinibacteria bacterium CG10_big_fil_rev_8_21_14_0_10_36_19]
MIDKPYPPRPRRKPVQTLHMEADRTIKALIITLGIMIVALSVIFLISTNESSQLGYTLQQVKLENEELKTENRNLTTQITESTAVTDMKMNMTPPEQKTYVTEEDNKVK